MAAYNSPNILLVEDEPSLIELLQQNLEFEGYSVQVARNGEEGLRLVASHSFDLILLDLMLPKMSGIELCKQLRAKGDDVLIIMVTAKGEVSDKVRGLKVGADDYLTKPFDLMELLARIEAALRRKGKSVVYQSTYILKNQTFDFDQFTIQNGSTTIQMTRQEALLLQYLVHQEGKILSREQIFQDIWGHDHLYSYRTIDTHITKLRQKIEANPSRPKHILTVHRVGYKFVK